MHICHYWGKDISTVLDNVRMSTAACSLCHSWTIHSTSRRKYCYSDECLLQQIFFKERLLQYIYKKCIKIKKFIVEHH